MKHYVVGLVIQCCFSEDSLWSFARCSMAMRKCKVESTPEKKTQVLVVEEVAMNYHFKVDRLIRRKCRHLEAKVRSRRAQIGDEAVDGRVGDIIPNLGCTINRDTKFYRTVELYWHVKAMVAQGRMPQEREI
jgi:hypothetical protein